MRQEKQLTQGGIAGPLVLLALPLLAGNILQQFYNTADAVIIGRWVSGDAFGAVGVAGTVMNLFLFVLSGGCTGIGVLFAQAYGTGDRAAFRRQFFQAALVGGVFALGLTLLALVLLDPVLAAIQTPQALRGYARTYLRVICGGFVAALAYHLCAAALRAVGDTLAALGFLAVSIGANVGLDLWFVAGLRWGIAGAAWATVLSQVLAAGLSILYLSRRYPTLLFRREDMGTDRAMLGRTIRFGAVSALQQSSIYIGKLLVQGAVNTLGTPGINGYTAGTRIEGFANSFGDSGAAAEAVFLGQNTGGGQKQRVRRGFYISLGLMLALGVTMGAILHFGAEPLACLVLPGDGGEELEECVNYLRLIGLCYPLCFVGCAFVGCFQGTGRVGVPAAGSALHLTLRVILSWMWVSSMGLKGVAAATGLGWGLVVCFHSGMYRRTTGRAKRED